MRPVIRVVPRDRLTRFAFQYPDAAIPIRAWFAIIRYCRDTYESLESLAATFPRMHRLAGAHVAFDLGGCKYWIVADVRHEMRQVYVLHVFTSAQYLRYRRTLLPDTDSQ